MEIKDIVQKAHDNAVKHGFWDPPLPFGTAIALIHSELSEALEEERAGRPLVWYHCTEGDPSLPCDPADETEASSTATKTPVSTGTRSPKAWPWNWPTP
jgi:hypothetical protein